MPSPGSADASCAVIRSMPLPATASSTDRRAGSRSSARSIPTRNSSSPKRSGSTAATSSPGSPAIAAPSSRSPTGAGSGRGSWGCSTSTGRSPRPAFPTRRSGAPTSPTTSRSRRSPSGCRLGASCTTPRTRERWPPTRSLRRSTPIARPAPLAGRQLQRDQAILGVFDEGCMGMFNAIIPDHLLHALGLFKERLSQSALFAAMQHGPRFRRSAALRLAARARHALRPGRRRSHDAHRAAGARGAPHVRCGSAPGPRLRLRGDRDPVSAGTQGHLRRVGPHRGAAQQPGSPAGVRRRGASSYAPAVP